MSRSRYSIVVYRSDEDKFIEVKNIGEDTLDGARKTFTYQFNNLRWSLAHRTNMGISKEESLVLHLFDNREGFELAEEVILP